jgi:hypothetical protein
MTHLHVFLKQINCKLFIIYDKLLNYDQILEQNYFFNDFRINHEEIK